jgi:hypothetical protein
MDIHNIILKEAGIDLLIEKVIQRLGMIQSIYLTGDFARGKDGAIIEIILIGKKIDSDYLARKIVQAENMIGRKVSYSVLDPEEADCHSLKFNECDFLPLWKEKIIGK